MIRLSHLNQRIPLIVRPSAIARPIVLSLTPAARAACLTLSCIARSPTAIVGHTCAFWPRYCRCGFCFW